MEELDIDSKGELDSKFAREAALSAAPSTDAKRRSSSLDTTTSLSKPGLSSLLVRTNSSSSSSSSGNSSNNAAVSGGGGRSLVSAVPAEILQQIMSFADAREVARYATVCSRFRQETRHTLADQHVLDLRWWGRAQFLTGCPSLVAHRVDWKALRCVKLYGPLAPQVLQTLLAAFGEQLQELSVESKRLQADDLALLSHTPHLRSLALPGCMNLHDDAAVAIAQHCTALELIDLTASRVSDVGVAALVNRCRGLRTVVLRQCIRITSDSLRALSRLPLLESLDLDRCLLINNAGLVAFSEASQANLAHLSVQSCLRVSGVGLEPLLRRSGSNLRSLCLGGCKRVANDIVELLPGVCAPSLVQLELAGCNVTAACLLKVASLRSLEQLNITLVQDITPQLMALVTDNCVLLEKLVMHQCRISDDVVAPIARLPRLKRLNLAYNYNLSDAALAHLCRGPCAKTLQHIDLRLCNNISPDGFRLLAQSCPELRSVVLGGVTTEGITAEIIRDITKLRPRCSVHY